MNRTHVPVLFKILQVQQKILERVMEKYESTLLTIKVCTGKQIQLITCVDMG
uniref:Uncharacterized protein n=1 Tax=Rhizophora mucronata TaxID=61149 RepID=A0A2P2QZZ0_RHIMU